MTRRRWVAVALVGVWAVALVGAAVWSAGVDPPTVREQSELAQGRQALDRAVEEVAGAAGVGVAVDVRGYRVDPDCRISVLWRGTSVEQEVLLTVREGTEPSVLERLAEQLPEQWRASHFRAGQRLSADAGEFVTVVGEVAAPGQVRVTAATGCRAGADPDLDPDPDGQ